MNRLIVKLSNSPSTRSPASAALHDAQHIAACAGTARSNAMPFQLPTITGLDAPSPSTNRPGAAAAIAPRDIAIRAGPRVYTGTIAVPSRSVGSQAEASASGVNASVPLVSADHTSV